MIIKNIIRHIIIILLIASVIILSMGCGSGLNGTNTTNSDTIQTAKTGNVPSSNNEKTERIELSNYLLNNVDIVHDELGGQRVGSSAVKQYVIDEPGDISVLYANGVDEGMYVLTISMYFSGSYRAGECSYSMFGCELGDTANDVRYRLLDYGFQHTDTINEYEYYEIYDGEWKVSFKCDNGFLNVMTVNCTRRTMGQALQN